MLAEQPARNPYLPNPFPAWWASDWGQDQAGLWMAFTYKGVRQAFRWIRPGRFQMGSPEFEAERLYDETLHEVTLTRGYWLADTACTLALWRVAMGDNPAHFNDEDIRPVEPVSWQDIQQFVDTLNGLVPSLQAVLPTEAQWEYACRAGTVTPFSFGENITPAQVNFNGKYPYKGGKRDQNRGKTVPVKSLPANAWGLYEMHGNVWEWCRDWYGDYPKDATSDPGGPYEGGGRVLRGGSWFLSGGLVRSARRLQGEPGLRDDVIGFRLALD